MRQATEAVEASPHLMSMADDLDEAALKAVRIADIIKQVCAGGSDSRLFNIISDLKISEHECEQAEELSVDINFEPKR